MIAAREALEFGPEIITRSCATCSRFDPDTSGGCGDCNLVIVCESDSQLVRVSASHVCGFHTPDDGGAA